MYRKCLISAFTRSFAVVLLAACFVAVASLSVAASLPPLEKAGVRHVRCMFRDHYGLVWIGTNNGLFRFDGTNTDRFIHHAHNPGSIPQNEINTITEDRRRHIWIGTNLGVAMLDSADNIWRCYNKNQHTLDEDFDNKIYCDASGNLWAGNSKGLFLFDNKRNSFSRVWGALPMQKSSRYYVTTIADWKADTLAVGTLAGLVLINKTNFGYRAVQLSPGPVTVDKLWVDAKRRIWIGTWGKGCILTDSLCRKLTTFQWEKTTGDTIANVVTGMLPVRIAERTDLWISTLTGIYRVANTAEAALGSIHKIRGGADAAIMLADKDDYIWTGGLHADRFFAGEHFFKPYHTIKGIVEDIKQLANTIAVTTWYARSGINVFDQQSSSLVYSQPFQQNIDDAAVSGIATDKFGRIWAGTLNGVKIFNKNWREWPLNPPAAIDNSRLLTRRISTIDIIRDTVWVSEYGRGVELFDLNFHKLKTFLPNDGSGLHDNLVTRFFCDPKGRTWLCGNAGLYLYHPLAKTFSLYNLNEEKGLFSVNDITALPGDRLAVASATGLYLFDIANGKATKISAPLVADDNIQSVATDNKQNIWYITQERLIRYQPGFQHFTVFGEEDGLSNDEELEWLRSFDGNHFYLAGKTGLYTFNAASAAGHPAIKVYLHNLLANDSVVRTSSEDGAVILNYHQRRLSFEFGAVNFIKAEQNEYAWRLDGVDEGWTYSLHNTVSYDNLSPGTYHFEMKAKNAAGVWSGVTGVTIIIKPPFWATWWFRLLCTVSIFGLLFAGVRYVLQRNLRERILSLEKEQAVEKERNRIAVDMHDDLGSGLTKIAILSELTRAQIADTAIAGAQLGTISTISREMVESLQNIVWLLDPRNDSLESLALYIRRYVDGFFELTDISPVFEFAGELAGLRLSEKQRRNIFLVVKEACNNVAKHAQASGVCIGIHVNAHKLTVTVADNGCGFDATSSKQLSNGLQNMQTRMEQIDGEVVIGTSPGQGTNLTFMIRLS